MSRFLWTTCVLTIVFGGAINASHADFVVLAYDTSNANFESGQPSDDITGDAIFHPGFITPNDLSRGSGLVPNNGITFNSTGWSTALLPDLNSDDYISWGWSSSSEVLDLKTLDLEYDVSATGPSQLVIAASLNGGPFEVFYTDTDVEIDDEAVQILLSGMTNVTQAEFRLFGYAAQSTGGSLDIENVEPITENNFGIIVRADFAAVPEPTSLFVIASLAGLGLLRRSRA